MTRADDLGLTPPAPGDTRERATQRRVLRLFVDHLGYGYLGDRRDRPGNDAVEETELVGWLTRRGTPGPVAKRAAAKLKAAAQAPGESLYDRNEAAYGLLRYGANVKAAAGENAETIQLIDWANPGANDFAVAEEVTLRKGGAERRPDVVLYVNGIALGVLELKRGSVSLDAGVAQAISNQHHLFNPWFYGTVQLVMAGNDSQGLRYGTVGTPANHFQDWKEAGAAEDRLRLDARLLQLCGKARLLELLHDFVVFDGGVKKLPRYHQFAGLKAAQPFVHRREGGILWHTQGSGKSILMVLLGKWVLENLSAARVLVVTDRDDLDKQIGRVFERSGEAVKRAQSRAHLREMLAAPKPRMMTTLVQKFGASAAPGKGANADAAFEKLLAEVRAEATSGGGVSGELFVFVDECHRTQSGRLHALMKAVMPDAVMIGFTGTPLLKRDAKDSRATFGGYIHTYKFAEAVGDEVVLDLVYESRDIDQRLGDEGEVDAWFEAKTRGLNDWQRAELRKTWATMQKVLSSKSRRERIVMDVVTDFGVMPRLDAGQGNAMLVAGSIYEAAKYFAAFDAADSKLRGKVAVVTSYDPHAGDVSLEDVGAETQSDAACVHETYTRLLKGVKPAPGKTRTETYEDEAKKRFVEQPAAMKLLIVVDKLLTGFDAPPCTVLYIDKRMRDHGLFQAICRTNRLDGPGKTVGHVVDYMNLFDAVRDAVAVYTGELDESEGAESAGEAAVMLKDRLVEGRERLDACLATLAALVEPVEPPAGELQLQRFFVGHPDDAEQIAALAPRRAELYKAVVSLLRAYANLSGEMAEAGYTTPKIAAVAQAVHDWTDLRGRIKLAAGEELDTKPFEADMRHLLDMYVEASAPDKKKPFEETGLLEVIEKLGIEEALTGLAGEKIRGDAAAETIEGNLASRIREERMNNPAFYDRMSAQLKELIRKRREQAIAYQDHLAELAELVKSTLAGVEGDPATSPLAAATPGTRALLDNLPAVKEGSPLYELSPLARAEAVRAAVRAVRPDGWRGNKAKERVIAGEVAGLLGAGAAEVEALLDVLRAHGEEF